MIYGYVRVSTKDQSYEYQKAQILSYSNEFKLGNVELIEDIVSGAKDWKQRAIGELVNVQMKEGDVVACQ